MSLVLYDVFKLWLAFHFSTSVASIIIIVIIIIIILSLSSVQSLLADNCNITLRCTLHHDGLCVNFVRDVTVRCKLCLLFSSLDNLLFLVAFHLLKCTRVISSRHATCMRRLVSVTIRKEESMHFK